VAVATGNEAMIEFLVASGADINAMSLYYILFYTNAFFFGKGRGLGNAPSTKGRGREENVFVFFSPGRH
jgi:hypothetical protein